MKILILSDSHGNVPVLKKIVTKEMPCDFIIHCGDGVDDIRQCDTQNAECLLVSGNMDLGKPNGYARSIITSISGFTLLVTHGDIHRVHQDYIELHEYGRLNKCAAVIFGHTHRPYIGLENPVLFNPGPALNGLYGLAIIDDRLEFLHCNMKV